MFILYKCDQCEYVINKKSNFEHHRQFHVKKSAYQCHRCSYSVSVTQRLTYHLKNHHSELDQVIWFIILLKSYLCVTSIIIIFRRKVNYCVKFREKIRLLTTKVNVWNHTMETKNLAHTRYFNLTHYAFGIIVKGFINFRRSWEIWILFWNAISATFPPTVSH